MKDLFSTSLQQISRISFLVLALGLVVSTLGCDRGVEPFDPNEEPSQPDLARIFPETGESRGAPSAESGQAARSAAASRRGNSEGAGGSAPAGASGAAAPIRGVIEIAPGIQASASSGSVLFVIARTQPAGPPLAVLRVAQPRFPHDFEIGQQNVMMPSLRFEGAITLSARLDHDGSATTKLAGDLVGSLTYPVAPGATGVKLTLDQKL